MAKEVITVRKGMTDNRQKQWIEEDEVALAVRWWLATDEVYALRMIAVVCSYTPYPLSLLLQRDTFTEGKLPEGNNDYYLY